MIKHLFFLLLHFLFANQLYAGSNYYVSVSGNNSNNGSLATAWKTIQYGINTITANDTLNILTGTYNEKLDVNKSNICIRNHNGSVVVLSGTGITSQVAMINISDRSNVTIEGLEIANNAQTDAQGILVEGACTNITIQFCKIHDIHFSSNPTAPVNSSTNAQGIIVYGTSAVTAISNLKIHSNELYNCRLGYSEGIAVNGNVDGFEITSNEVHDITNIGIDAIGHEGTCPVADSDQARNGIIKNNIAYRCLSPYATSGGIYVDGGKNIIIENNTSYHNGYGIEVGCENKGKTTDKITVRNNIFFDNEICAIALGGYDYPSGSGKVTNAVITNNTCFKNDYKNNGTGELYLTYSENSVIENNIFYLSPQNTLAYAELGQPSLQFNYNLYYGDNDATNMEVGWNGNSYSSFASFKSGTATNGNSKIGNPDFTTAAIVTPNFHINAASAAKESGNPLFVAAISERDMDNEIRVAGIVDCGADEYYAAVTTYSFTGNGNWNIAGNWDNGIMPPAILTGNAIINIDPLVNGECILNISQQISAGVQLVVKENKKFRIEGGLVLNK